MLIAPFSIHDPNAPKTDRVKSVEAHHRAHKPGAKGGGELLEMEVDKDGFLQTCAYGLVCYVGSR